MKFNTQYTVVENCKGKEWQTLTGDSKEVIYDLKYSASGEPYLVDTGKVRNVFDEIQKAKVLLVDIADLYERFVAGDEDCLNIVFGGEYLDTSVWSQDMIVNAGVAYNNTINPSSYAEASVSDTENKTESEGKTE